MNGLNITPNKHLGSGLLYYGRFDVEGVLTVR